eukprot:scaffold24262_cov94-Skeletonema_dohrnii-CCMP3373.AAC.1
MLAPSFSAAAAASVSSAADASNSDLSRSDISAATNSFVDDRATNSKETRCQFMMKKIYSIARIKLVSNVKTTTSLIMDKVEG